MLYNDVLIHVNIHMMGSFVCKIANIADKTSRFII